MVICLTLPEALEAETNRHHKNRELFRQPALSLTNPLTILHHLSALLLLLGFGIALHQTWAHKAQKSGLLKRRACIASGTETGNYRLFEKLESVFRPVGNPARDPQRSVLQDMDEARQGRAAAGEALLGEARLPCHPEWYTNFPTGLLLLSGIFLTYCNSRYLVLGTSWEGRPSCSGQSVQSLGAKELLIEIPRFRRSRRCGNPRLH